MTGLWRRPFSSECWFSFSVQIFGKWCSFFFRKCWLIAQLYHFICKPSLSLFPFLSLSAFRRGGAVYNSTEQFLWINPLTGCCFQSQSHTECKCLLYLCILSWLNLLHPFIWVLIWLLTHSFIQEIICSVPLSARLVQGLWMLGSCLKQEFLTCVVQIHFRGSLEF